MIWYIHVRHAQLNKGGSDLAVCFEVNQHGVKCRCSASRELAFNSLPQNTTVATSEKMAQNTYGKLSQFDLNSTGHGCTEYCEEMEYYFSTNAITDGKQKKAILLASVDIDTFKLSRNLFGQEDIKAETTTLENSCKRVQDRDFFDCVASRLQSSWLNFGNLVNTANS